MAIDLQELEKRGVSSGNYKKLFTAKKKDARVQKLIDTLGSRSRQGIEDCLRDHRGYWAVDLAYEAPVNQTTPVLIQALCDQNLDAKGTLAALSSWGLKESDLFITVEEIINGNKVTKQILNPPILFNYVIPVVKAYVTVRLSKIYNERDKSPLLPYSPLKQTDKNRVVCDIVTDFVDTMAMWYGYPVYLKDAILQTLKYGIMLAFPKEEWHCEKQIIGGSRVVQKEGLRYDMPHPTRMFYDPHHPLWTLNTDTGCEYAGHWHVSRAGDILDNRMYWNRSSISFGQNWMDSPVSGNYFREVFPCRLSFPVIPEKSRRREDKAAYYTQSERDSAMFLTTQYFKLIPSKWGLGDYKYPVWHRFDMAGDDTVIWAAPCAYNPIWFMGYDFDSQAARPSSLALETMPWQYHLGNILTNMVRTAKQNLLNITWYDKQLVDKKNIDAFAALGDAKYAGPVYLPYDSQSVARLAAAGTDITRAFLPVQNQYRSIAEFQQMLSVALSIMERVLQISAQETGAPAAHYQSAKEVGLTSQNTSQRLTFTASGIDDGIDAWKRQLFDAAQAYMNNDVTAQVSSEIPDLEKHLKDLGFKVESPGQKKVLVAGSKKSLRLEGFARSNLPPGDNADREVATAMMQAIGIVAQNQEVFAAVGATRIIKIIEVAARLAGAGKDFDITSDTNQKADNPELLRQITPLLQQLQATILQTVQEKIAAPAAQQDIKQEQQIQILEQTVQKLQQIFQASGMDAERLKLEQAETQQRMQIEREKFTSEQQRKQQEHDQKLQLNAQEAQIAATLKASETEAKNIAKIEAAKGSKSDK